MSNDSPSIVTRFAPSPTGLLHLGHAYSALFTQREAKRLGGRFLLRIEDIDTLRCKEEFEAALYEDLSWLGLEWETPVRRQSDHMDDYANALDKIEEKGLLYPCFCSRRDIRREIAAANSAPHHGPEGPHYPGICRGMDTGKAAERRQAGEPFALRLDTEKALSMVNGLLIWEDVEGNEHEAHPEQFGDVVLARKDILTSYHLAVTIDDDLQGVNLIIRGEDLLPATDVHRLLQELLGLNVPKYQHHHLLKGEDGRRFAKRDKSETIRALREAGRTVEDIKKMAGI
jgi:glutamyl-Q tRNA(Asp) synthetase